VAAAVPLLELDRGRIRLANSLFVYLERTLAPSEPLAPGVTPRPYGLAPAAVQDSDAVLAAVAPGEAIWLGFQAIDRASPATVRVRVDAPAPLDAVSGEPWDEELAEAPRNHLVCPPDYCLPGLRTPDGYVPFGEGQLTVLTYEAAQARVPVRLVTPEAFTRATGMVADPLDPGSAYKGWRLP
jgi:hypothetical protein